MSKSGVVQSRNGTSRSTTKRAKTAQQGDSNASSSLLSEMLNIAAERGLLSGSRTHIVRGRMPAGLVAEAKLKSGISSDSKLLEVALANLAVADDYAEWLVSQRGTVRPEIDLEF